jgi:hypothetical protein
MENRFCPQGSVRGFGTAVRSIVQEVFPKILLYPIPPIDVNAKKPLLGRGFFALEKKKFLCSVIDLL